MKRFAQIASFAVILLLAACSSDQAGKPVELDNELPFAERKITDTSTFTNNVTDFDDASGAIGVLNVPEMLVLSIMDSAASKDVSATMVKNYALLEEELLATGSEMNGAPGMITYNNDVTNFKFENVLCIKRMPSVQPKKCRIVVLEATKMLVYNFYGPYQNLFAAYDRIKVYCKQYNLVQTGPLREFYITDPEKERDRLKWLTRIMIPVATVKKEKGQS